MHLIVSFYISVNTGQASYYIFADASPLSSGNFSAIILKVWMKASGGWAPLNVRCPFMKKYGTPERENIIITIGTY